MLFVVLAVLESHRDVILRYLVEVRLYDQTILFDHELTHFTVWRDSQSEFLNTSGYIDCRLLHKYCNELSMTIDLDSTLAQAEVLYLSFAQLVADIDRRQAEDAPDRIEGLRKRGRRNAQTLNLPLISENLRELLQRNDT